MRKLSIAAFIALGVLAGCNNAGNQSPNAGGQTPANANTAAGAANAPIPSAVSGSVTLKDPVEISQGSKLDIKLVDGDVLRAQHGGNFGGGHGLAARNGAQQQMAVRLADGFDPSNVR